MQKPWTEVSEKKSVEEEDDEQGDLGHQQLHGPVTCAHSATKSGFPTSSAMYWKEIEIADNRGRHWRLAGEFPYMIKLSPLSVLKKNDFYV